MTPSGLSDGDDYAVIVLMNKVNVGEVTGDAVSNTELTARIYTEDQKTLMLLFEIMAAAFHAIEFHMQKPHMRKLLEDRIAQIRAEEDDSEAGEPPSPTVHDIPF